MVQPRPCFWCGLSVLCVCVLSVQRVLEEASSRLGEVTKDPTHYQEMLRDLITQVITIATHTSQECNTFCPTGLVSAAGGRGYCEMPAARRGIGEGNSLYRVESFCEGVYDDVIFF